MTRSARREYGSLAIIAAVLIAAVLLVRHHAEALKGFIEQNPFWGVLLYIVLNVLDAALAPGATLPLIPVAVRAWGRVPAALVTTAGWTAGDPAEAAIVQKLGMKFFRIGMTTHDTPSDAELAGFLRLVNDPANQPVYVHCQGGRHRTGVMTAIYRMTADHWTADQAFAEMKQYKFGPDFLHPEFKKFVYAYRPQTIVAATATS